MLIQLPNGLLDGADLFNYAEIDELRGKQQNYLVDKELVIGNIGHVPKIVEDMLLVLQTKEGLKWKGNISEAVQKLPSGDIETILIKVRENTYGPKFYHEAECSHCGHVNPNLRLDLDTLKLDEMPVEEMIKSKKFMLPKMKVEVEFKNTFLKDLFEVIKITQNKQKTIITSLASVSLKRLGDKSPVTEKDVENIPASDLAFIQEKLEEVKLQGTIETDIDTDCKKCGKEFRYKLNAFEPSFFDHTKGSAR